jgi:Glycosyltransferase family 87
MARRGELTLRRAGVIAGLWSLPLLIGPPLFSKDLYSYIGQGTVAHRGLDPYRVGPNVLGHGPLLESIASVWRHAAAPYGPLFIEYARGVVAVFGSSIVTPVIALRAIEIVAMALILVSLPVLARRLGVDAGAALWLGALSPLVLLSFVSSGHNDGLMLALVVAGLALGLSGRPWTGLVLCAVANTVKTPAAAAVVVLAIDQVRSSGAAWRTTVLKVIAVPVATIVAVGAACGLSWGWLAPSNLRIPTELRIQLTPVVSLGVAVSRILNLVRIPAPQAGTVTVFQLVAGLLSVVAGIWLLATFRREQMVRTLGILFAVVVLAGPTLWPWYLTWALVILAATSAQRSVVLVVVGALGMAMVGTAGTPMFTGYDYWAVAVACVIGVAWLATGGRWRSVARGEP